MTVWEAIALHTTPEIPRYKQPEVRLVSLGVKYDVRGQGFDELSDDQRAAVLAPSAHELQGTDHHGLLRGHTREARDSVRDDLHGHPRGDRARIRAAELLRLHPRLAL
jgi:hypothetical protein